MSNTRFDWHTPLRWIIQADDRSDSHDGPQRARQEDRGRRGLEPNPKTRAAEQKALIAAQGIDDDWAKFIP